MTANTTTDIHRADRRFHTNIDWLDSRHSFSFGPHYDPANTHFGVLMVSNDDVVKAGTGFETHPHRDMEIVTWVLVGLARPPGLHRALRRDPPRAGAAHERGHRDPALGEERRPWRHPRRRRRALRADVGGARHGEDRTRLRSAGHRTHPGRGRVGGGGVRDAPSTSTRARSRSAKSTPRSTPRGSRPARRTVSPVAPLAHLFVARGSVELEGTGVLGTGDAARITGADGQRVTAGPDGAEVLIWEMHATLS